MANVSDSNFEIQNHSWPRLSETLIAVLGPSKPTDEGLSSGGGNEGGESVCRTTFVPFPFVLGSQAKQAPPGELIAVKKCGPNRF